MDQVSGLNQASNSNGTASHSMAIKSIPQLEEALQSLRSAILQSLQQPAQIHLPDDRPTTLTNVSSSSKCSNPFSARGGDFSSLPNLKPPIPPLSIPSHGGGDATGGMVPIMMGDESQQHSMTTVVTKPSLHQPGGSFSKGGLTPKSRGLAEDPARLSARYKPSSIHNLHKNNVSGSGDASVSPLSVPSTTQQQATTFTPNPLRTPTVVTITSSSEFATTDSSSPPSQAINLNSHSLAGAESSRSLLEPLSQRTAQFINSTHSLITTEGDGSVSRTASAQRNEFGEEELISSFAPSTAPMAVPRNQDEIDAPVLQVTLPPQEPSLHLASNSTNPQPAPYRKPFIAGLHEIPTIVMAESTDSSTARVSSSHSQSVLTDGDPIGPTYVNAQVSSSSDTTAAPSTLSPTNAKAAESFDDKISDTSTQRPLIEVAAVEDDTASAMGDSDDRLEAKAPAHANAAGGHRLSVTAGTGGFKGISLPSVTAIPNIFNDSILTQAPGGSNVHNHPHFAGASTSNIGFLKIGSAGGGGSSWGYVANSSYSQATPRSVSDTLSPDIATAPTPAFQSILPARARQINSPSTTGTATPNNTSPPATFSFNTAERGPSPPPAPQVASDSTIAPGSTTVGPSSRASPPPQRAASTTPSQPAAATGFTPMDAGLTGFSFQEGTSRNNSGGLVAIGGASTTSSIPFSSKGLDIGQHAESRAVSVVSLGDNSNAAGSIQMNQSNYMATTYGSSASVSVSDGYTPTTSTPTATGAGHEVFPTHQSRVGISSPSSFVGGGLQQPTVSTHSLLSVPQQYLAPAEAAAAVVHESALDRLIRSRSGIVSRTVSERVKVVHNSAKLLSSSNTPNTRPLVTQVAETSVAASPNQHPLTGQHSNSLNTALSSLASALPAQMTTIGNYVHLSGSNLGQQRGVFQSIYSNIAAGSPNITTHAGGSMITVPSNASMLLNHHNQPPQPQVVHPALNPLALLTALNRVEALLGLPLTEVPQASTAQSPLALPTPHPSRELPPLASHPHLFTHQGGGMGSGLPPNASSPDLHGWTPTGQAAERGFSQFTHTTHNSSSSGASSTANRGASVSQKSGASIHAPTHSNQKGKGDGHKREGSLVNVLSSPLVLASSATSVLLDEEEGGTVSSRRAEAVRAAAQANSVAATPAGAMATSNRSSNGGGGGVLPYFANMEKNGNHAASPNDGGLAKPIPSAKGKGNYNNVGSVFNLNALATSMMLGNSHRTTSGHPTTQSTTSYNNTPDPGISSFDSKAPLPLGRSNYSSPNGNQHLFGSASHNPKVTSNSHNRGVSSGSGVGFRTVLSGILEPIFVEGTTLVSPNHAPLKRIHSTANTMAPATLGSGDEGPNKSPNAEALTESGARSGGSAANLLGGFGFGDTGDDLGAVSLNRAAAENTSAQNDFGNEEVAQWLIETYCDEKKREDNGFQLKLKKRESKRKLMSKTQSSSSVKTVNTVVSAPPTNPSSRRMSLQPGMPLNSLAALAAANVSILSAKPSSDALAEEGEQKLPLQGEEAEGDKALVELFEEEEDSDGDDSDEDTPSDSEGPFDGDEGEEGDDNSPQDMNVESGEEGSAEEGANSGTAAGSLESTNVFFISPESRMQLKGALKRSTPKVVLDVEDTPLGAGKALPSSKGSSRQTPAMISVELDDVGFLQQVKSVNMDDLPSESYSPVPKELPTGTRMKMYVGEIPQLNMSHKSRPSPTESPPPQPFHAAARRVSIQVPKDHVSRILVADQSSTTRYRRSNQRTYNSFCSVRALHNRLRAVGIPFITSVNDPDFNIFEVFAMHGKHTLTFVAVNIFFQYQFMKSLETDYQKFVNFCEMIESCYRYDNPYHNAIHAADVLQTTNVFLCVGNVRENFSDVELFAVLFAALIHDVGHIGVDNNFLIKSRHPIAKLYCDRSPMESMHAAYALAILERPTCNFLSESTTWTNQLYDDFRGLVSEVVRGTDMKLHNELISAATEVLEDGNIDDNEVGVLLKAIVHAADLSNAMKPTGIYCQWVDRVIGEFWRQGDEEQRLGLPVSLLCDRTGANVGKSQVGFINFVVSPFMTVLAPVLPSIWMTRLSSNLEYMRSLTGDDEAARIRGIEVFAGAGWTNPKCTDEKAFVYALREEIAAMEMPPPGVLATPATTAAWRKKRETDAFEISQKSAKNTGSSNELDSLPSLDKAGVGGVSRGTSWRQRGATSSSGEAATSDIMPLSTMHFAADPSAFSSATSISTMIVTSPTSIAAPHMAACLAVSETIQNIALSQPAAGSHSTSSSMEAPLALYPADTKVSSSSNSKFAQPTEEIRRQTVAYSDDEGDEDNQHLQQEVVSSGLPLGEIASASREWGARAEMLPVNAASTTDTQVASDSGSSQSLSQRPKTLAKRGTAAFEEQHQNLVEGGQVAPILNPSTRSMHKVLAKQLRGLPVFANAKLNIPATLLSQHSSSAFAGGFDEAQDTIVTAQLVWIRLVLGIELDRIFEVALAYVMAPTPTTQLAPMVAVPTILSSTPTHQSHAAQACAKLLNPLASYLCSRASELVGLDAFAGTTLVPACDELRSTLEGVRNSGGSASVRRGQNPLSPKTSSPRRPSLSTFQYTAKLKLSAVLADFYEEAIDVVQEAMLASAAVAKVDNDTDSSEPATPTSSPPIIIPLFALLVPCAKAKPAAAANNAFVIAGPKTYILSKLAASVWWRSMEEMYSRKKIEISPTTEPPESPTTLKLLILQDGEEGARANSQSQSKVSENNKSAAEDAMQFSLPPVTAIAGPASRGELLLAATSLRSDLSPKSSALSLHSNSIPTHDNIGGRPSADTKPAVCDIGVQCEVISPPSPTLRLAFMPASANFGNFAGGNITIGNANHLVVPQSYPHAMSFTVTETMDSQKALLLGSSSGKQHHGADASALVTPTSSVNLPRPLPRSSGSMPAVNQWSESGGATAFGVVAARNNSVEGSGSIGGTGAGGVVAAASSIVSNIFMGPLHNSTAGLLAPLGGQRSGSILMNKSGNEGSRGVLTDERAPVPELPARAATPIHDPIAPKILDEGLTMGNPLHPDGTNLHPQLGGYGIPDSPQLNLLRPPNKAALNSHSHFMGLANASATAVVTIGNPLGGSANFSVHRTNGIDHSMTMSLSNAPTSVNNDNSATELILHLAGQASPGNQSTNDPMVEGLPAAVVHQVAANGSALVIGKGAAQPHGALPYVDATKIEPTVVLSEQPKKSDRKALFPHRDRVTSPYSKLSCLRTLPPSSSPSRLPQQPQAVAKSQPDNHLVTQMADDPQSRDTLAPVKRSGASGGESANASSPAHHGQHPLPFPQPRLQPILQSHSSAGIDSLSPSPMRALPSISLLQPPSPGQEHVADAFANPATPKKSTTATDSVSPVRRRLPLGAPHATVVHLLTAGATHDGSDSQSPTASPGAYSGMHFRSAGGVLGRKADLSTTLPPLSRHGTPTETNAPPANTPPSPMIGASGSTNASGQSTAASSRPYPLTAYWLKPSPSSPAPAQPVRPTPTSTPPKPVPTSQLLWGAQQI